jgi:signal recognition particle subunit SRP54
MGDIVALVEKAAANIDAEKAARTAEKMRKGQFDLADMREQLHADGRHGRHVRPDGHDAGHRQDENQIANAGLDDKILKRQVAIIDSMTPQERRNPDLLKASRKKRIAKGSGTKPKRQQTAEDASRHGRHDEGHGFGQARPDGRARPDDGLWRRHAQPTPEQMAELAKKMPGGQLPSGMPSPTGLPPNMPNLPPNISGLPGLGGPAKFPGLPGLPGYGKKK